MNIYFRELRASLKSLIVWSVVIALIIVEGFSEYSAYAGNPEILEIMYNMPEAMLAAFQMQALNMTTISGFTGIMYGFYALLLGIAAAMWGSDIISKEERDKTVEFSLTLPVTRSRVVTAKALVVFTNCLILNLFTGAATLIGALGYNPDDAYYRFLALCLAALFLLQVVFLTLGLLLGCALKQYRRTASLAVSIPLGMYVLSTLTTMTKNLDFLKYLTPFRYFDPVVMLNRSRLGWGFVLLALAIAGMSMTGAYFTYNRRDLCI